MTRTTRALLLGVCGLAAAAGSAGAQEAPPAPSEATTAKVDPTELGAATLSAAYGLSDREAKKRAALEPAAWAAIERIAAAFPDDFSGVQVAHVPQHELRVYLSRDIAPPEILALVDPSLRSVVKIKRVAVNRAARVALIDEAAKSLRAQGIDFSVGYDLEADGLDVGLANAADAAKAKAALPERAQRNLRFSKGGGQKPKVYTRPTGVLTSDQTFGGWELYHSKTGSKGLCTIGFTGRDSYGDTIAITAGHCLRDTALKHQTYTSNRYLTLPVETFRSAGSGSSLDVGHVNMQGVTASGGWVFTKNNVEPYEREYAYSGVRTGAYQAGLVNTVSNFAGGYLKLAGVRRQSAQGIGLNVCKYGVMTGLTCSVIRNDYYSSTSVTGFVETYNSPQWYVVGEGDSGGPVFTLPDANSMIYAVGIVSGGLDLNHPGASVECKRDPANFCTMTYMPADRIDDLAPAQLFIHPSGTAYPGGY